LHHPAGQVFNLSLNLDSSVGKQAEFGAKPCMAGIPAKKVQLRHSWKTSAESKYWRGLQRYFAVISKFRQSGDEANSLGSLQLQGSQGY